MTSKASEKPTESRQRGRPVEGSVIKGNDGRWRVRLTIPGTKLSKRIKLGPEIRTEARAKEVARHWHEKLRENPELLQQASGGKALTCGQYLERWTEHRRKRLTCADDDRQTLLLHVFDDRKLRDKPAASVTRADLRDIVARLDSKVQAGIMQASTAGKMWAKARCMFHDMFAGKANVLCIREDDPTAGVRGPDKGADKEMEILYPNEATILLSSPAVSLARRRIWALLFYSGLRVSELRALDWESVDWTSQELAVRRSQRVGKDAKHTKTGRTRRVPIVPALLPVLRAMHEESGGTGHVVPKMLSNPAEKLRSDCQRAGLTRQALYTTDATHRALRAQDARATTATWLGMALELPDAGEAQVGRRVSTHRIEEWIGHEDLETTETYYLRGRGLRVEHVGVPFPPLPDDLSGRAQAQGCPNSCQDFLSAEDAAPIKCNDTNRLELKRFSHPGTQPRLSRTPRHGRRRSDPSRGSRTRSRLPGCRP